MILWLERDMPFPDPEEALTEKDGAAGLLAAGADLSPARLVEAYQHGIFPWYAEGQPILWWSTDPRMVLMTDEFMVSASFRKTLKKVHRSMSTPPGDEPLWEVRFDTAFERVMRECAAPRFEEHRQTGTWISEEIIESYCDLHRMGLAHSAETWLNGTLVGGAYGVCIGQMFYGESMFARISDASKIALAYLVKFLKEKGVRMIDCQQETSHLASLGAAPIPRSVFLAHLRKAIHKPPIENWKPVPLF
jgi:leucyl/phenylalanyl-tRNA--protein transferase